MFRSVNKKDIPLSLANELRGSFVFSHSRCFALVINYFAQHNFFCAMFCVVHLLRPTERVCSFEFFGDVAFFYQPGEGEFDLSLGFLFGIVEVLIECARGEKRGVGAAAVLFEIVEAQFAVLANGVVGLFGKHQIGIHNAVSFCVNEFHNSSSVIQYFSHSHSTIFVLKRRMCGMAFSFYLIAVCDKVDGRKIFFEAQDKFRVFVSDIE